EKGRRMREACKYIDDYIYNMINNYKSELEIEKQTVSNLLALLINAVDDNGNDRELRDVVLNLIVAGRDTTAQALSWMMYSIMTDQSVEDLLLQEINTLLSPEMTAPLYDDHKLYKYTLATFYETLRLYPIVPSNGRYPDRAIGINPRKDLVGPKGVPIFGNLFSFLKRKTYIQFSQELVDKYGSLYTFTILGFGRVIVSNDPQTIEHLLKTNFEDYGKSDAFYKMGYDVFGDGIFAVDG
ncbi:34277_t:CDS:2, partial [Racocetra persica]